MTSEAIAVTGMSTLFAGSPDWRLFWHNIVTGRDLITDVPPTHWLSADYFDPDPRAPDKIYCQRGSFLDPVAFDSLNFGIPPSNVPTTDTSQLLALILAERLFQDICPAALEKIDRERISVILGVTGATELTAHMSGRMARPQWEQGLRESGFQPDEVARIADRIASQFVAWQESTFPGLLGNVVAGRIANRFDLGGTNCIVDAACASSLGALTMAINELQLGQSDLVITGGVDTLNDPLMYLCFSKTPALSSTGDCRPFSDRADGTLLGEGLALVALRRLSDAERDGDRVYAVIKGVGTSSDGRSKSVYAPRSAGQARALRRAYDAADYDPRSVELVEAHGTATRAGDVAEFEALNTVFSGSSTNDGPWCALGSIKSQIGHTKAAAGVAGLAKAVLALHHKVLPPTIKVQKPNQLFQIEQSPFFVNTEPKPWIRAADHPRRASVSSFGFGGSNFHVTLEEYQGAATKPDASVSTPSELILVSAANSKDLLRRIAEVLKECDSVGSAADLRVMAQQSWHRFEPTHPLRGAVVAENTEVLRSRLQKLTVHVQKQPVTRLWLNEGLYFDAEAAPGKTAWLFPGQGSQYVGMQRELAMSFDVVRQAWDNAASLPEFQHAPLHKSVFPPPAFTDDDRTRQAAHLRQMNVAQPAIAVSSLAGSRLLESFKITRDFVAGHSFGELTALSVAGVIDEADLIPLARHRAVAMSEAATSDSGMMAISAAESDVTPLLKRFEKRLVLANHNSPRQVVVSGERTALDEFERELVSRQLPFRRLDVAAACHSPLMGKAVESFRDVLNRVEFKNPNCRVGWNATGREWSGKADDLKSGLAGQLVQRVRFVEMIESLYAAGVRTFVEVGPSAVLTGLVNEILADPKTLAVSLDRKGQSGLHSLWHALGQLAVQGVRIDWTFAERVFAIPGTGSKPATPLHAISICGANPGKPYPANRSAAAPNPDKIVVKSHHEIIKTPAVKQHQSSTQTGIKETAIVNRESRSIDIVGSSPNGSQDPLKGNGAAGLSDDPWLIAFREVQQQTALAHQVYLQAMSETHRLYLQASAASLLPGDAGVSTSAIPNPVSLSVLPTMASMAYAIPPVANGELSRPVVSVDLQPKPVSTTHVENWVEKTNAPQINVANDQTAKVVEQPVVAEVGNIEQIVLEIVAAKTGYSVVVLEPSLQIEAGLGIDSIKRVEILSALVERLPQLSTLDLTDFATYQTLGDVISAVRSEVQKQGGSAPADGPKLELEFVQATLLEVVAEKTGYPQDLLDLELDIESGLGIDSIKRVEILSALIDRYPPLGAVDATEFNTQRTLGDLLQKALSHLAPSSSPSVQSVKTSGAAVQNEVSSGGIDHESESVDLKIREVELIESVATGFSLPGMTAGASIAILTGSDADQYSILAAQELERILRSHGIHAAVRETLDRSFMGAVHLGGLTPCRVLDDSARRHWEICQAAQAIALNGSGKAVLFVTVQDTSGCFGRARSSIAQAHTAGLAGIAKTAMSEWPEASIKAIDVERRGRTPGETALAIADELLFGGTELEVALPVDEPRATLSCRDWTSRTSSQTSRKIAPKPTFVVTGGARGVTAAGLIALAKRMPSRFVLLGRTKLDATQLELGDNLNEATLKRRLVEAAQTRGEPVDLVRIQADVKRILAQHEIEQTIQALEAAGSEVRYVSVDVRDSGQLMAALKDVRKAWGPIRGLVHGAGILADKRIVDKQAAQFFDVFQTKVYGLQALLKETQQDPLEWIVLFSSIAARLGNAGQVDYSAANEVLNKIAHHEAAERGERCRVLSINWGAWNGGMVDDSLRGHFQRQGISLIPIKRGADLFADLMVTSTSPPVEIVVTAEERADVRLQSPVPACHSRTALSVSVDRFPFIDSHRVKNEAVVPLALVVEWFTRALRQRYPHLRLISLHDLKVLRGISLSDAKSVSLLNVVFEDPHQNGALELQVELRGPGEVVHYRCRAELAASAPAISSPRSQPLPSDDGKWPWTVEQAYERLFHGPAFQVLQSLDSVNQNGARATLVGTDSMDWPGGPWSADPAALDGGMQVAVLWGIHKTGRMSLPSAVNTIRFHYPAVESRILHCNVEATSVGAHQNRFNIHLRTPAGEPIIDLLSVDMTMMQSAQKH